MTQCLKTLIGADFNRHVTSVDTDKAWLAKFLSFNKTKTHSIYHMENAEQLEKFVRDRKWGLVLVDHIFAEQRPTDVIKMAELATIVLAHDTEIANENYYGYVKARVTDHFKYVCKLTIFHDRGHISTLMLSNFIDITFLEDVFKKIDFSTKVIACDYKNY
jgi:hypothetical protein